MTGKLKQEVNRERKAYQDALGGKLTEHETKLLRSSEDIYFKTLNSYNTLKRKKEKLFWQQSLRFLKTKIQKTFEKN